MNTPIVDFIKSYEEKNITRMHMPGHKGAAFLGFESNDITEIKGADSLYHADGIICASEENASKLFETAKTVYSTEGSSICVKTMLHLALMKWRSKVKDMSIRPVIIAARNAHISFMHSAMLLDFDVVWLWPKGEDYNLLACKLDTDEIRDSIDKAGERLAGVYITSPDYLGNVADISNIAKLCHDKGSILLVDNAHGSYLSFINDDKYSHPIKLGADMCCDSAHKTLPVLTGGAYLHMNTGLPDILYANVKNVMNIYGSTSPSYLILQSLDLCNKYIAEELIKCAGTFADRIKQVKESISDIGIKILDTDPYKITMKTACGHKLAEHLRLNAIECEYSDNEYVVLMLTPLNTEEDLTQLLEVLKQYKEECRNDEAEAVRITKPSVVMTIREAMLSNQETVRVENSLGRICASPIVSCPPAIPVVVSGEIIDEFAITTLTRYNIEVVDCIVEV